MAPGGFRHHPLIVLAPDTHDCRIAPLTLHVASAASYLLDMSCMCCSMAMPHSALDPCKFSVAVMAAVAFLGEDFYFINGIGLVVLVAGVAVFNWTKYRKHLVTVSERGSRTPRGSSYADGHRRTSSDALEAFAEEGGFHGVSDLREDRGPPVSPLTQSTIRLQAANISGPASHRRDLPGPAV